MEKKELYLAKNLKELEPMYNNLDLRNLLNKPVSQCLITSKKVLEAAEKARFEGDEERSYVLYMKYMNLMSKIQKTPDFQKEKTLVAKMVGGNEAIQKHMDRIEKLSDSLRLRYEEKNENKPLAESTRVNNEEDTIMDLTMEETVIQQEKRDTIDCTGLFNMMETGKQLLILDCRSREHFESSKMNYQFTLNVPEEILNLGMSASKIQEKLPNESKVFWQMRLTRPYIIIVDWSSKRFNRNSPVWHLKEILTLWDPELEKTPEMFLLEGGYDAWKTIYPMKCINPNFSLPQAANGVVPGFEELEYPNLEDIQMKDTSLNKQVPHVDRSVKMNAIRAYETSKSALQLLEENEQIANKSLQTEKELLALETDFKKIVTDKENLEDSAAKEQSYLFKIWELQAKQVDYLSEEKSIKEQLEQSIEQIYEPQEKTKREEVESHIEEIKQKKRKVQEEREKKKKEREEALKLARDTKPNFNDHRTPPKQQRKEELILSPKALSNQVGPTIPAFDRTSKPMQNITRQIFNENDFLPVYGRVERGLTGLKNLGNTCYMNSIIQCLSNTSTLTQYLLENNFERHVNRSNKTKGHIVRTLAAVIKMLWNGECKYISSKNLKAAIGEHNHLFYGMDQQDSHEFLIMLIDWLQSDLQTITIQNTLPESLPASEKAWLEYTKAKESFILRLFYGQIKSTVKCTVCSKESSTYETFSNLSLELPPNMIDRTHIQNCFDSYFHGERVSGWNCPYCNMPREAIKKLDISKLPPILVIHLKRFYADPHADSVFRKKTIYVDFPLNDMNMMNYVARSERTSGSNSKHIYNLYAVSNHYGTMESGHYTAFCKNYRQKKWYKFDDHTVSSMDRSEVKSSAAYILFYTSLPESTILGMR